MILRNLEKLAVDANPILSAIIGGKAGSIFLKAGDTAFYTTLFNIKEVERYIPELALKRNIPSEDLHLALSLLPVTVCGEDFYRSKIRHAEKLIGKRDPDDRHLRALALKLKCPLWSNDSDFEGKGVDVLSTVDLLKRI